LAVLWPTETELSILTAADFGDDQASMRVLEMMIPSSPLSGPRTQPAISA